MIIICMLALVFVMQIHGTTALNVITRIKGQRLADDQQSLGMAPSIVFCGVFASHFNRAPEVEI